MPRPTPRNHRIKSRARPDSRVRHVGSPSPTISTENLRLHRLVDAGGWGQGWSINTRRVASHRSILDQPPHAAATEALKHGRQALGRSRAPFLSAPALRPPRRRRQAGRRHAWPVPGSPPPPETSIPADHSARNGSPHAHPIAATRCATSRHRTTMSRLPLCDISERIRSQPRRQRAGDVTATSVDAHRIMASRPQISVWTSRCD